MTVEYRKGYIIILLTAVLFMAVPVCDSPADAAGGTDLVRIQGLNPFGSDEWVSLHNYGYGKADLKGYSISDMEGELRFTETFIMEPFSEVRIAAKPQQDGGTGTPGTCYPGSNGIVRSGSYIMADAGDDVYLFRGEVLMDAVCYGSVSAKDGWSGDPVHISSGKHIERTGISDTDSSADWISTKPGFTDLPFSPDTSFRSFVTPFTFPESNGEPVYRELEAADREIRISIYQMTSLNIVSLLCKLESGTGADHVDVIVTLEGNPLGYDMSRELSMMKSLADAGGEIRIINDPLPENYERYSFFHNKYAIIDDSKVIITSENWTEGNMSPSVSNRGWGAVIESQDYAGYMRTVFDRDRDMSYGDVWDLNEYYPDLKAYKGDMTYSAPSYQYRTQGYDAVITPVMSPDNSYRALEYYMDNAKSRIYSEQLDLGASFSNMSPASPISWMASAANRGVDSRFILDASISGSRTDHANDVDMINTATAVKAITISGGEGFATTHNKGVIIDDTVWLGSVNWTENSFQRNREIAVLIGSPEVTGYFLGYFLKDWGVNDHTMEEEGLSVSSDRTEIHEGSQVVFTVSGPASQTYAWDVYGDGNIRYSEIPRIVCSDMKAGSYTLSVKAKDTTFSAEFGFTVIPAGTPDDGNTSADLKTVLFVLIAASAIAVCALFIRRHYKRRR